MVNITAGVTITNLKDDEALFIGSTPIDVQEAIDDAGYTRISEIEIQSFSGSWGEVTGVDNEITEIQHIKDYSAIAIPRKDNTMESNKSIRVRTQSIAHYGKKDK